MGFRVHPWRQGYLATRRYYGAWWFHLVLAMITWQALFIGNIIYAVFCARWSDRSSAYYLRLRPSEWPFPEKPVNEPVNRPKARPLREAVNEPVNPQPASPEWVAMAWAKNKAAGVPGYEGQPPR
jgi:hypothetical protein